MEGGDWVEDGGARGGGIRSFWFANQGLRICESVGLFSESAAIVSESWLVSDSAVLVTDAVVQDTDFTGDHQHDGK